MQGGVDEVHVAASERPTKGLGMKGARPMSAPSSSVNKGRLSCFVALVEAAMYSGGSEERQHRPEFIRFCGMLLKLVGKAVICSHAKKFLQCCSAHLAFDAWF